MFYCRCPAGYRRTHRRTLDCVSGGI